jgi:hypothetical protein
MYWVKEKVKEVYLIVDKIIMQNIKSNYFDIVSKV